MAQDKINNAKERHVGARIFGYCVNKLWLLIATFIIVIALIHIVLGIVLPRINIYQNEIIEWVQTEYGLRIEVSDMTAEWNIEGPTLALKKLKVKSEDGLYNVLELDRVSIEFDLLTSIIDWRLSTVEITIDGAEIKFFINRSLGVDLSENTGSHSSLDLEGASDKVFVVLFGQNKISLVNSNLNLYTLSGTEFNYRVDELEVTKYSNVHQLSGSLSYSGGGTISIVSEVFGDPTAINSYSEVYIKASDINVAELPWLISQPKFKPQSAELSGEFWGTWKNKKWEEAKAKLELSNTAWYKDENLDNRLSAMFTWQHLNENKGVMALHDIDVKVGDEILTIGNLNASFVRDIQQQIYWNLFLSDMKSEPLIYYIKNLFDKNNTISKFLSETNFRTTVDQLNLSLSKLSGKWQPIDIQLSFSELNLSGWNNIPALAGVDGTINLSENAGILDLKASKTDIQFGQIFRHTIQVDKLAAQIEWEKDTTDTYRILFNRLSLSNQDLDLQARGSFFYQDEQPTLSLYTELTNVNATNKSLYLPAAIMTNDLVSYLDESIKSGNLSLVKSTVRGPISSFPFAENEGVFITLGELKDATYQYLPDWPLASHLNAKLRFEGNTMDISSSKGVSINNDINFAQAIIEDLSLDIPLLELKLDVSSTNNSGRDFLENTPMKDIYNAISDLDYTGNSRTNIRISVGLDDDAEIKLKGMTQLFETDSVLKTPILNIDNLKGEVNYDQSGITRSELTLNYLEQKIDVVLNGSSGKQDSILEIDAKGIIPAHGITHFIGDKWEPFFEGEAAFTSLIRFSPNDKPEATRVFFQSDLYGMELLFPGEFGKKADAISETFLTLDIDETSTGELNLSNVKGSWFWRESTAQSGVDTDTALTYGGDFFINQDLTKSTAQIPGVRVKGKLIKADLAEWLKFVNSLDNSSDLTQGESEFDLFFESIELDVEELETKIAVLNNSKITLNKYKEQPWNFELNNSEIQGTFVLNEYLPWQIDLEYLSLNLIDQTIDAKVEQSMETFQLSPLDLHSMDIKCVTCQINGVDYGEVLAEIKSTPNGLTLGGTVRNGSQHDLTISGYWVETIDSLTESNIGIDLETNNVGKLLDNWSIDATVEDSPGRLYANIWWQGAPWDIDYTDLDGDLQLSLGKGYLSEISDGSGRLFSLFNLQSIIRKLTFDFKDVYKKGFFYDSIKGTFTFRDGVVST
ncbi:MAG: TIGR02099 family protein, partial [Kangiellaceae bacterium]|nr:TIGR02099 family protein [Kangiellaceae bacterium]